MILADPAATHAIAETLATQVRAGDVITLKGPLGAGKTELARALIAALGHSGEVPSPTFAIVQPYGHLDPPVWHADLYRLQDPSELLEIGLEEAEGGLLLVEWPERAGPGAFSGALSIALSIEAGGERCLTVDVPQAWEGRWPF